MIVAADISGRMTAEDYLKVFDLDGDGSADAAFLALCIADGESEVNMALFAAFGGTTLDDATGTVDSAIKKAAVVYAIRHGLLLNPLLGDADAAPYAKAFKWADAFLERLAKDARSRPVTSGAGRARPHAAVTNTQDAAGAYTNPHVRNADRSDPTGF